MHASWRRRGRTRPDARCGPPYAPSRHPRALRVFQNLPHGLAAGARQVAAQQPPPPPSAPAPEARPGVVRQARSPHTPHARISSPPRLRTRVPSCPGPALQSVSPSCPPLCLQGPEAGGARCELGCPSSGGGSGSSGMPPPP